jgi:phospholipase C
MKRAALLPLLVFVAAPAALAACANSDAPNYDNTPSGAGGAGAGGGGGGGSTSPALDAGKGSPDASPGRDGSSGGEDGGGTDGSAPSSTPIKHIIVIIKENHTFDNYFGSFPGAEGTSTATLSNGSTIQVGRAPDNTPRDMDHSHSAALTDWAGGQMNGWDKVSGTSSNGDNLAYAQYQEADIPNYWAYAKTFTLGDHFFANVLAPSFPGHMFPLAAQSGWAFDNPSNAGPYWGCDQTGSTVPILDQTSCTTQNVAPCFSIPSVPDVLPSGVDWKFYGSNYLVLTEIWSMFDGISKIRNGPLWSSNVVDYNQFDTDIKNGTLPAVTWLVDQDLADEHPNIGSVCVGENWTVQRINEVMQSPYWANTAILFTMDDFGGWYDHVAPPRQYGCDKTNPFGLGFRLPLLVISPYAKPGYVFSEVAEQASIPRFIERVFGSTQTLNDLDPAAQDKQANDLFDAFDFNQTPLPPLVLQQRTTTATGAVCF